MIQAVIKKKVKNQEMGMKQLQNKFDELERKLK